MKSIYITIITILYGLICNAQTFDGINCVNASDSIKFRVIIAQITEVSITATNAIKHGTLNWEYIGKVNNEEVRICPCRDIDIDDSNYEDVKIGEYYVLVVHDIPSAKEEMNDGTTPYNPTVPVADIAKRTWELKSFFVLNINFNKMLPFQECLELHFVDHRPEKVKNFWEKFENSDSIYGDDMPEEIYMREVFELEPQDLYQVF